MGKYFQDYTVNENKDNSFSHCLYELSERHYRVMLQL